MSGLKIILFKTENFGGYVAENWSAFANIAPWVFVILEDESMDPAPPVTVPDPATLDVGKWTKKQLPAWMEERRLDVPTELRKKELANEVRRLLQTPNCPNAKARVERGIVTATTIRRMHLQVSRYCNALMATDLAGVPAANRSLAHAMSYLSLLDTSYKTLQKKDGFKAVWIQTYTLLGILRAPTHFYDYVWVRSLYEGGDMGEGVVKHLRPLSPTGVKMNWSFHVVEGYYRRLTMSFLQGFLKPTNLPNNPTTVDHRSYVRYGTRADIHDKIDNRVVLSILIYKDTLTSKLVIGSIIIQCKQQYLCEYKCSCLPIFEDKFGYVYFTLELTDIEHQVIDDTISSLTLVKTGFALPLIDVNNPTQTGYCVMSDDGDSIDNNHKLQSTL